MTQEDKSVDDIEQVQPEATEAEAVDEATEAAVEVATEADLVKQLQEAEERASAAQDQYIRAEAEMANLRRRVEKDVENAHKFGQEKLSKELLGIADNLERALQSTESDAADINAIREGVELTLKGLVDVFGKFNIVAVDPIGEPFDPQLHQAMSMVENPDVEPNTVIAVMQKGYQLNGRLIRPAMVMVSKGGQAANKIDEQA
ncbi:nucleotide exchange factor GrpE [Reinekea marinisedimentorum]|uniref:Protein GrpE n=1 Tax=Reinekea marinisedimentorum TaxID=230495 RepID=A0A4R3IC95_9GAMM|nr:nucleotide exchange factor GrpE [Reinekea marinisedimentorum]TCS43245.1 molecular chaperone GrpE [Reinekea marinisedimentorum]